MAFNEQEKQLIIYGRANGKSQAEVEAALIKLRAGIVPTAQPTQEAQASQEPSLVNRIGADIQQAGSNVADAIQGEGQFKGQSDIQRGVQATAQAFNAIPKVASEVLPKPVRSVLGTVGDMAAKGYQALTNFMSELPSIKEYAKQYPDRNFVDEILGTMSAGGQIAGTILTADQVAKGAQATVNTSVNAAKKTAQMTSAAYEKARPATAKLLKQSGEMLNPKPSALEATGEILQGKVKDVKSGIVSVKNLDIDGVDTYAKLEGKLTDGIANLSSKVDDQLAKDPTPIPLTNLVTKTVSKSGAEVSRNYVQTAIDNLKELYTKTADDVQLANINELMAKAETTGLTRLEVNDISRLYNIEFGQKAFSKIGEPLTSVNAQMYENIRSGLKDVARQGMGGTEAAQLDKVISSMYNTKALVSKSVEAVNKLNQRIAERGLLEQAGHFVSKYADILTGGSIRGFIGGLLPRGAGYKVLNSLDLEARLADNLKILKDAIASNSDADIVKILSKLGGQK